MQRVLRYDGLLPNKLKPEGGQETVTTDDIRAMADYVRERRGSLDGFDIVTKARRRAPTRRPAPTSSDPGPTPVRHGGPRPTGAARTTRFAAGWNRVRQRSADTGRTIRPSRVAAPAAAAGATGASALRVLRRDLDRQPARPANDLDVVPGVAGTAALHADVTAAEAREVLAVDVEAADAAAHTEADRHARRPSGS